MTISLQELSQRFAEAVHGAMPSADLLPLQDIQRAEGKLRQLAQRLAPYVHGDAAVAEESLKQLAEHYIANPQQEPLDRLFSRFLYQHVPGRFRAEGASLLAPGMGKTVEALLQEAEAAGKLVRGKVFASIENVGLGCRHVFNFKPGLNRERNIPHGLLAYAGVAAILHGGKRAFIGSHDEEERTTTHHWVSGSAESLAGCAAIAAALKLAEKNIAHLK